MPRVLPNQHDRKVPKDGPRTSNVVNEGKAEFSEVVMRSLLYCLPYRNETAVFRGCTQVHCVLGMSSTKPFQKNKQLGT